MKTLGTIIILLLMLAGLSNDVFAQKSKEKTVVIEASMTCGACKAKIEKDIAFEKGVKAVEANLENKQVTIKYVEGKNTDENLVKAIEKLGYKAKVVDPKANTSKNDAPKKSDGCCGK
jgi:copper chaperone CopZ